MRPILLACVLAVLPSLARADFASEGAIDAEGRNSMNFNFPTPTYGFFSSLVVGRDGRGAGNDNDAAVKFFLGSVIPPGYRITSAILTINVAQSQSTGGGGDTTSFTVAARGTSSGPLTLDEFLLSATTLATQSVPLGIGSPNGPYPPISFDVTSVLGSLLATGAAAVDFQFDPVFGGSNSMLSGMNDAVAANRPNLLITYSAAIPEPSSKTLMAIALLALSSVRYWPWTDRAA